MKFIKITEPLKNQDYEAMLRRCAADDKNTLLSKLETSAGGLDSTAARDRLDKYGENVIDSGSSRSIFQNLREAFVNPFNLVLVVIAVITYITDVLSSSKPDYFTIIIIFSLILISGFIAFIQNRRSNNAAEKLSQMLVNRADVLREGAVIELPISRIVPGDIVKLSAGDMLPADVRFIATKDTFVAQGALTGESNPVEKFSCADNDPECSLTDLPSVGFMGTNIVSGTAAAVVLATGKSSYFGAMAESLSGQRSKNSFEKGVDSVSHMLIRLMLIMVPIVFLINGFVKSDWPGALLFAVSIAVGLTPEMLPVIMTSTLAKGAVIMSEHNVIVKSLSAIQTFGEMDVLCTDKTGTLTEDRIVLEKYMDVQGNDDLRILRHAFLNSYFQTGLKNLIDLAIINRAYEENMENILTDYSCIDEIPFDFTRRRMSVLLSDKTGKRQLITKGAVEEVLSVCSFVEHNGKILPLDEHSRQTAVYEKYNLEGLRMLAVAQKNDAGHGLSAADECNMVLIGFVGFLDPPKASAKAAVGALKEHGVRTVVLTGDSEGVALKVCGKVGVDTSALILGAQMEHMDDEELSGAVNTCSLFAKLSPSQKQRVISALQQKGCTVGYMGDGINDAPALRQADVGISVDSAVDIAKETADIILLKKDLMVLEQGVLQGRRTFGNIVKYIKMAASGNFGNMISVIIASIFLPFLPMLPVQLLTQNLLCDFSQMGIPFDNVDEDYLKKPRRWETGSIKSFMACMGPLSSIFDILCFAVLWFVLDARSLDSAPMFQCGWFLFGTLSQVLVIHMIRTGKTPIIQSRPSSPLLLSSLMVAAASVIIAFTSLAVGFDMKPIPVSFSPWLILMLAVYCISTQLVKNLYIKKYGEWL